MTRCPRLAAAALLAATTCSPVMANPDVWVTAAVSFGFDHDRVTSVSYEWRFDDYYSSRTMRKYDADANGSFDADEVGALRRELFDPLSRFHYHVYILAGEEGRREVDATEFSASIDGTTLVYSMTFALQPAVNAAINPLVVSLFDEDTVLDFKFARKDFVKVEGAMNPDCRFRVARGKSALADHPQTLTVSCGG